MNMSSKERTRLGDSLPPAHETRTELKQYMSRNGLTQEQLASLTKYSRPAICHFLGDKYPNDEMLRRDIVAFLASDPENIASTILTKQLYETEDCIALRAAFLRCHDLGALGCCYAPPGTGKTFIVEHIAATFNRDKAQVESKDQAIIVTGSINIRPRDLLARICRAAGVMPSLTKESCLGVLRVAFRRRKVLIVVDEAQLIEVPTLEVLRELRDLAKTGVLLLGSHALMQRFRQHAAQLEQFNSRLRVELELKGVSDETARVIVRAELPGATAKVVDAAIAHARVPDIYSTTRGKTYLSMRRISDQIEDFRKLTASKSKEVVQ